MNHTQNQAKSSGYVFELKFQAEGRAQQSQEQTIQQQEKKARRRNITWFNLPLYQERHHECGKKVPGHCERVLQKQTATEENLQQKHAEAIRVGRTSKHLDDGRKLPGAEYCIPSYCE